jgi:hypothetical protein
MVNLKVTTVSVALFGGVTFTLCVLYGLVVPQAFHGTPLLEMVLPGFRWLSLGSFVLGLVESVILGAYLGAVFSTLYNWTARQLGERRA